MAKSHESLTCSLPSIHTQLYTLGQPLYKVSTGYTTTSRLTTQSLMLLLNNIDTLLKN